ncbi:MAG: Uma2 family endonuclease [Microscillaceae bacterium]|jgi:Uma2 family endonuclease|nr:Uma2 family endonuclease [Microscillaceae bacterium]
MILTKAHNLSEQGLLLQIPASVRHFTDDELFDFCAVNQPLHFERDKFGNIYIIMPTGSKTSELNAELVTEFVIWNRQYKLGKVFDFNGGFILPDTSMKAADVAWVELSRWQALTKTQQSKFAPICPDFVLELMSPSDDFETLHPKMLDWLSNGCRLAWLIDLKNEKVYVYENDHLSYEVKGFDQKIDGGEVLPNFVLDLNILSEAKT